ncbi:hypothetical protein JTB14_030377 [Gonioctena quinquepunctata]|nr:hypothetical protein JTB14_030377 [Gonioctena quinquepunctata]
MNFDEIQPKSSKCLSFYNSGFFPSSRPDYKVCNIGKTPVYVQLKYGTAPAVWWGSIGDRQLLQPREECVLSTGSIVYYVTAVEVFNESDVRALVHTSMEGEASGNPSNETSLTAFDGVSMSPMLRKLILIGSTFLPPLVQMISMFITSLWPNTSNTENLSLDRIMEKVATLVDGKVQDTILGILEGEVRCLKEKLEYFKSDMEGNSSKEDISSYFMNIAENMVGLEKKFYITDKENLNTTMINYYLLPLYSTIVTFKLMFYQCGIVECDEIGLSPTQVQRLNSYSERLVRSPDGPRFYIETLTRKRLDAEYNYCRPETMCSDLAAVKTYCALHGHQYLSLWENIVNPGQEGIHHNDAILYAPHFGVPTPNLAKQLVYGSAPQPLQPTLIHGKLNKLSMVLVYKKQSEGITGMAVHFENGNSYMLGRKSETQQRIEFQGDFCLRLRVWGGADGVDGLEFQFSNGRREGTSFYRNQQNEQYFHYEHYHIAGIFASNDREGRNEKLANLTVAFQLTPTKFPEMKMIREKPKSSFLKFSFSNNFYLFLSVFFFSFYLHFFY